LKTRYFRRVLEGDAAEAMADGWTNPTAVFVPSLAEAVVVLERPSLCPDRACKCQLCSPAPSETVQRAQEWLKGIGDLLAEKNRKYGDSAANPMRVFSKASPVEQLLVRIDDKLSRIQRGGGLLDTDEDVLRDLVGYVALLAVMKTKE
jgi:hypothetical protein